MLINASRGQKRLVTGKQDVMAGGETAGTHHPESRLIRLIFKEQIAFVLMQIHPQRANFPDASGRRSLPANR